MLFQHVFIALIVYMHISIIWNFFSVEALFLYYYIAIINNMTVRVNTFILSPIVIST